MEIINANVTIMVADMDVSLRFYQEILGFTLKSRFENHWADLEAHGFSIGLHPTSKTVIKGDNLQIGIKVPNLDSAIAELKENNVSVEIPGDDQVSLVFFSDPDGNKLYLIQDR